MKMKKIAGLFVLMLMMHLTSFAQSNYSSDNNYSSSKVIFCTDVDDDGDPISADNEFIIARDGSYVQVLVKNGGYKLNTTGFNVKVYKMKGGEYQYKETKNITGVETNWVFAYFKYSFYESGDYKFVVYDADNSYVNKGYVTIKFE